MTTKTRRMLPNGDVIRNVRIGDELDSSIRAIADAEERTISNTIQRLLRDAVRRYCEVHPELSV